jgi:tRNA(fMet)-specific endonuclease VapC
MAETYMLDTDICGYIIKNRSAELRKIFLAHQDGNLCISAITYAEILYGLENRPLKKLADDINAFISLVRIVDWNQAAAREYAKIRHFLTVNGKIIGDLDMQIAAAALALGAILITHNKKHFSLVPKLSTADWS